MGDPSTQWRNASATSACSASAEAQPEGLRPQYQYVWSARYVDAAVLRDENTDSDGACDDDRVYYLTDANQNVTALVDASGTVVERYVYDPYGEVTIYDDDWSETRTTSAEENTRLYTGRERDEATWLYYYRARWYDTGTGQFTTRDPLGFAAGDTNLYRYVGNRPVGSTDPTGLWELWARGTGGQWAPTNESGGSGGSNRQWGQDGWWWFNPWSYTVVPVVVDPRMWSNIFAGNTTLHAWDADRHIKEQEQLMWERQRDKADHDPEMYRIYYERYYKRPLPQAATEAIQSLEQIPPNFPGPTPIR